MHGRKPGYDRYGFWACYFTCKARRFSACSSHPYILDCPNLSGQHLRLNTCGRVRPSFCDGATHLIRVPEYVAPLGSTSLIFNFLFARFLVGTPVTATDIYVSPTPSVSVQPCQYLVGYYYCHTRCSGHRRFRLYQQWPLRGNFGCPPSRPLGSRGMARLLPHHVTFPCIPLHFHDAARSGTVVAIRSFSTAIRRYDRSHAKGSFWRPPRSFKGFVELVDDMDCREAGGLDSRKRRQSHCLDIGNRLGLCWRRLGW